MNTTTKMAAPTEDEVMAALARENVSQSSHGDETRMHWSPASRLDVAHRVAMARGWDGTRGWTEPEPGKPRSGRNVGSREKGINLYVSAKAVGDILERLRRDGRVQAFYGRHKLISGKYGINPASVYYLTPEALDVALGERRRIWVMNTESSTRAAAEKMILDRHAAEIEEAYQLMLASALQIEPDWRAMLDENPASRP